MDEVAARGFAAPDVGVGHDVRSQHPARQRHEARQREVGDLPQGLRAERDLASHQGWHHLALGVRPHRGIHLVDLGVEVGSEDPPQWLVDEAEVYRQEGALQLALAELARHRGATVVELGLEAGVGGVALAADDGVQDVGVPEHTVVLAGFRGLAAQHLSH